MSKKAVREYDGKRMLAECLTEHTGQPTLWNKLVQIKSTTNVDNLPSQYPWLNTTQLVAKPDQLIKRRGKAGLVLVKADYNKAIDWINERRDKPITVFNVTGVLDTFLIEQFYPHQQQDEYYICMLQHKLGYIPIGTYNMSYYSSTNIIYILHYYL